MKQLISGIAVMTVVFSAGCAPVLVGAGAAGVYKVATEERTAGTMLDDSSISASIKMELLKDPLVKGRRVDVNTLDGHVILSGVLESELQADRAVEIANQFEGVKSVKNNFQIGSRTFGQSIDDRMLGTRVKTRLIGEPGVSSMNINVDVRLGTVTLSGIVDDLEIKNRIIEIARQTEGTLDVVDNIHLRQTVKD